MQLLQRSDCGGYVIAEDASHGMVKVVDKNRPCPNGVCSSYDLESYKERTMIHVRLLRFHLYSQ